jgi:pentatricopeptide repeat protein
MYWCICILVWLYLLSHVNPYSPLQLLVKNPSFLVVRRRSTLTKLRMSLIKEDARKQYDRKSTYEPWKKALRKSTHDQPKNSSNISSSTKPRYDLNDIINAAQAGFYGRVEQGLYDYCRYLMISKTEPVPQTSTTNKLGPRLNLRAVNKLFKTLGNQGEVKLSHTLYRYLRDTLNLRFSVITYTVLISQAGEWKAESFVREYVHDLFHPHNRTSLVNLKDLYKGKEAIDSLDIVVFNAIFHAYAKLSKLQDALELMSRLRTNYSHIRPDTYTFTSLLNACVQEKQVTTATQLLELFARDYQFDWQSNPVAMTTMMSLYCATGDVHHAEELLNKMLSKGLRKECIPAFGLLIHQYGSTGDEKDVDKAFQYFHDMTMNYRIPPNTIHFTSLIHAAGRVGRVETVLKLYDMMNATLHSSRPHHHQHRTNTTSTPTSSLPVQPNYITYCTVIDVALKQNNLDFVIQVIQDMKRHLPRIQWNAVLYTTLLTELPRIETKETLLELVHSLLIEKGNITDTNNATSKKDFLSTIEKRIFQINPAVLHNYLQEPKTFDSFFQTIQVLRRYAHQAIHRASMIPSLPLMKVWLEEWIKVTSSTSSSLVNSLAPKSFYQSMIYKWLSVELYDFLVVLKDWPHPFQPIPVFYDSSVRDTGKSSEETKKIITLIQDQTMRQAINGKKNREEVFGEILHLIKKLAAQLFNVVSALPPDGMNNHTKNLTINATTMKLLVKYS